MSDRVTITMSDGTTREVHPEAPVEYHGEYCSGITEAGLVDDVHGDIVATVFEPTREHWTPYEPWMRDVLADDARVSVASSGTESRSTWDIYRRRTDSWAAGVDLRIHPDDCPERPTEDDAEGEAMTPIDHARDIIERHLPAMPDQVAAFVTRDAALALDAAGLLVTPSVTGDARVSWMGRDFPVTLLGEEQG